MVGLHQADMASDSLGHRRPRSGAVLGQFLRGPTTGRLATLGRPNGVSDTFSFDTAGRLTARNASDASDTQLTIANYTYNTAGQRDSMTDLAGTHNYSYDTSGRLTSVRNPVGSAQPDEIFTYDTLGNRTSWNANPASQVRYDASDHLTQDATYRYTYDREGNQLTRTQRVGGAVTSYAWDSQHHLRSITNPDGSMTRFGYDALGRRAFVSDPSGMVYQVWARANLRATLDSSGEVHSRLITTNDLSDTLAMTKDGSTAYPVLDGLGSTTALTDSAGGVSRRNVYSAFGESGDENVTTIAGFTGYQHDTSGLDYARARYYDPRIGRFLSEDPQLSTNLYSYAANNPISFTDPTGAIIAEEGMLDSSDSQSAGELCAEGGQFRSILLDLTTDLLFSQISSMASGVPGIYVFETADGSYVGRSNNIRRRLLEHIRRGKLESGANVRVLERQMTENLDIVEQSFIQGCNGGEGVQNLANEINAINATRRDDLRELLAWLSGQA